MLRLAPVLLLFCIAPQLLRAQFLTPHAYSTLVPNLLYIELMGSGGMYSLNYEQLFASGEHIGAVSRFGFSAFPAGASRIDFRIPVMVSCIVGGENYYGEIGGGAAFGFDNHVMESGAAVIPVGIAGFRFHPTRLGGIFCRLAYTPSWVDGTWTHGAGFAVGVGLGR
ncbi:MAG: hypothetical protein OHK0039_04930 [Bacteroidia bacterium]